MNLKEIRINLEFLQLQGKVYPQYFQVSNGTQQYNVALGYAFNDQILNKKNVYNKLCRMTEVERIEFRSKFKTINYFYRELVKGSIVTFYNHSAYDNYLIRVLKKHPDFNTFQYRVIIGRKVPDVMKGDFEEVIGTGFYIQAVIVNDLVHLQLDDPTIYSLLEYLKTFLSSERAFGRLNQILTSSNIVLKKKN